MCPAWIPTEGIDASQPQSVAIKLNICLDIVKRDESTTTEG